MLRGWGASPGTQAWNARLDPAVGWLSPLPHPLPSQPATRCSGEERHSLFSGRGGKKGANGGEKRLGVGAWRGKREDRREVSEVLADPMTTTTPSRIAQVAGPTVQILD